MRTMSSASHALCILVCVCVCSAKQIAHAACPAVEEFSKAIETELNPQQVSLLELINSHWDNAEYSSACDCWESLGASFTMSSAYRDSELAYMHALDANALDISSSLHRRARILVAIGRCRFSFGNFKDSAQPFEHARELLCKDNAEDSLEYADCLLRLANTNLEIGKPKLALEQAEDAMDILTKHATLRDMPHAWLILAKAHRICGNFRRFDEILHEGDQCLRNAGSKPEESVVHAEYVLEGALGLHDGGLYDKSEKLFTGYAIIIRDMEGQSSWLYARALRELARHHYDRGQFQIAFRYAKAAYKIKLEDRDSSRSLESYQSVLGAICIEVGELEKADELLGTARLTQRATISTDSLEYGETLFAIAKLHRCQGKLDNAINTLDEVVALYEKALGESLRLVPVLDEYASILRELKQIPEANEMEARVRTVKYRAERRQYQ